MVIFFLVNYFIVSKHSLHALQTINLILLGIFNFQNHCWSPTQDLSPVENCFSLKTWWYALLTLKVISFLCAHISLFGLDVGMIWIFRILRAMLGGNFWKFFFEFQSSKTKLIRSHTFMPQKFSAARWWPNAGEFGIQLFVQASTLVPHSDMS